MVVNKIDTLQAENPQSYVCKVKEFLVKYFQRENIIFPEDRIIPISCKKETNIFVPEPDGLTQKSFSDVAMEISNLIIEEREKNLIQEYLPTRFSVLCTNRILGIGTIAQGFMLTGEIMVGDEVLIMPGMIESEVDGIESYYEKTSGKGLSKIIALNLKGIRNNQVNKGNVIILKKEYQEWKNDELQNKMVQMKETILNMNLDQMYLVLCFFNVKTFGD
jgi:translation elongation factor EF-1alpha